MIGDGYERLVGKIHNKYTENKTEKRWICDLGLKGMYFKYQRLEDLFNKSNKILEIGCGTGVITKQIFNERKEIHCLDISISALKRVESFAKTYLMKNIDTLPLDYFDLVIHNLVAQHVYNDSLLLHFKYGLKALKKDGIFCLQFAEILNKNNINLSKDSVKKGGYSRTKEEMKLLVKQSNGKIIKEISSTYHSNRTVTWHYFRIQKVC